MKKWIALLLSLTLTAAAGACNSTSSASSTAAPSTPASSAPTPVESTPAESSASTPTDGATTIASDVTLDVIISQYGNYTQTWWDQFVTDFQAAYPNVTLNLEIVSWNDLYTVVNTRISTNQAPDILNIDTFADYVADDLLMPAEEYTSPALKEKIFPGFWEANDMDGTVWALPILASARALFYNKDILEQAGITNPPANWDELTSTLATIKEKVPDVVPWGLDISTDEGQAAFSYYTWNNGGGFVDAEGNWALNSAANVEALNYIKSLVDAGYCNANPYTDTRYPLQDAFGAGSLAMMIAPNNLYDIAADVNFGVASIPTQTGEAINMGVCDRLMAFKDDSAEDPASRTAAITAFFDFFYDTDRYSNYMVYEGFLPVTTDSAELLAANAEQYQKGGDAGAGNSEYFSNFNSILATCNFYPTAKAEWIDVKQGVIDAQQRVCQGEDAQTVLDELQAAIAG